MTASLITLFLRDLDRLKQEIMAYREEATLWKTQSDIKNSGGNLALHLIGNLNFYMGSTLGNSGYIRVREKEFSDKNIAREKILEQIDALKITVEQVLTSLTQQDLDMVYPINVLGMEMKTSYFLIHLYGHFNYHLGQINYHRRLLDAC